MDKKYENLPEHICYGNAIIILVIYIVIAIAEARYGGWQDAGVDYVIMLIMIISLNLLIAVVSSFFLIFLKKKNCLFIMQGIMRGTLLSIGFMALIIGLIPRGPAILLWLVTETSLGRIFH